MYINKVTIYGRLTKDPEQKVMPNGNAVVNFSMATNRAWKNQDGTKGESVEFHNLVCFGKRAEVISQYVNKGQNFLVYGRLQTRNWEDKDSGKKLYRTEIVVEDFSFGDNPKKEGHQAEAPATAAQETAPNDTEYPEDEINPDDIPF